MTTLATSSDLSIARYATKRSPDRRSLGGEVAAIAKTLGTPLLPWQRQVADVALEMIEDETGLLVPAFREVIVTVPRQSGKTTLVLALELQRALRFATPQRIAYTAQTGWDARRKLIDDQVPTLEASPIRHAVRRVYRGAGMEGIVFKNGSRIETVATTPTGAHGRTLDMAVIDEAFSDELDIREQALLPTMATRKQAQLYVVSTAGTERSIYFRRKVEQGRAFVEADRTDGIAFFEWSADSEDDPYDPEVWARCMPALGHTIDEKTVRHAQESMPLGEFRRSYLNVWQVSTETMIPEKILLANCDAKTAPAGSLVFGLDVALDRSSSSIVVADEAGNVELVENRPGVSWVTQRILELSRRWRAEIVVDGFGPAGSLIDPLEKLGVKVNKYGTRDMVAACGLLYDALLDKQLSIKTDDRIVSAVLGARKRIVGQSWLWARVVPDLDITPLYALTVAWHYATYAKKKQKPKAKIF